MNTGDVITTASAGGLYVGCIIEVFDQNGRSRRKVTAIQGHSVTVRELTRWEDYWYSLKLASKRFVRRWFPEYEPEYLWDYLRLPWSLGCWCFAWAWTQVWYPVCRLHWWIRSHAWTVFWFTRHFLPLGGGRREDTDPVYCPRCLWAGPTRWLVHTYTGGWDEDSDVEPVDECPRCGTEV